MAKIAGAAQLSPLSLSILPSDFCNDEINNIMRSTLDALRRKKITLLTGTVFFLLAFFNLILKHLVQTRKKN
jgi:hypothetical protein